MMNNIIRIGTRKSALAIAQTKLVAKALKNAQSDLTIELVKKQTKGDKILDKPLLEFGGKGVFVSEFEEALLKGDIDLAVHSAKDLPMELEEGLGIVAVPKREDPRDVLVTLSGTCLSENKSMVIGTSSLRRKMQIEEIGKTKWPKAMVDCKNLRGNVQTRLSKLEEGQYDGIILAAAGLKRLGLLNNEKYTFDYFDCETFIPAGGQGILAVEGRLDSKMDSILKAMEDEEAKLCLTLERKILRLLEAGCHEPIGVYSRIIDGQMEVMGISKRTEQVKRIHMFDDLEKLDRLASNAAKGLL